MTGGLKALNFSSGVSGAFDSALTGSGGAGFDFARSGEDAFAFARTSVSAYLAAGRSFVVTTSGSAYFAAGRSCDEPDSGAKAASMRLDFDSGLESDFGGAGVSASSTEGGCNC